MSLWDVGLKVWPLIQDVEHEHRWYSTKVCFDSFLNHPDDRDKPKFENIEAIDAALSSLNLKREKYRDLRLVESDMVKIENLNSFLSSLEKLSTSLSGKKYPTSSIVVPVIKSLQLVLEPSDNDVSYIEDEINW